MDVSILVLLDEGCRPRLSLADLRLCQEFQSLFSWMKVADLRFGKLVNSERQGFQSLFSWMKVADTGRCIRRACWVPVSILVLLDEGCRPGMDVVDRRQTTGVSILVLLDEGCRLFTAPQ